MDWVALEDEHQRTSQVGEDSKSHKCPNCLSIARLDVAAGDSKVRKTQSHLEPGNSSHVERASSEVDS